MAQKIFQVDAFTDRPFAGNPAGVCIVTHAVDERWMQNVAMEMNLSETAFLHRLADGWSLRWFTPGVEVDLCGHATLASAHTLWETGSVPTGEEIRFHTKSGLLTAHRDSGWIVLDFPSTPPSPSELPEGLAEAIGVTPRYVAKSKFDYLLEIDSEDDVRRLEPNTSWLRRLPVRGIIVTARASSRGIDFVSRFFAPGSGVDEDPVTGSAHCCLTPYWSRKLGKSEMVAYQASRRGGTVKVRLAGDRVLLAGQAVTTLRGELVTA